MIPRMLAITVLCLSGCGGSVEAGNTSSSGGSAGSDGGKEGGADVATEASSETSTPMCGDPAVLARYPACKEASTKQTCEAAGGSWGPIGLAPFDECQCPTGQESCKCTDMTPCLTACIAQPTGGAMECNGVTEGHCSPVEITVGCWCLFDKDGKITGMCVD